MKEAKTSEDEPLRRCQEAEREARAEAEQAIRLRDEFMSTLAHELRNPLNSIFGWAEVLRQRIGPADTRLLEGLQAIERAARVQSRMITDLQDLSGLLSGKTQLRIARTDACAVASLAIDATGQAVRDKQLQVSLQTSEESLWLMADPQRLQQLLCSLLDNAIKFSPAGGRVQVSLEQSGGSVAISVTDNGAGIDPALLPRLFDRFQRDARPRQRSSGLGLSLVRVLSEMHGGSVEARSDGLGTGASFRVLLPLPAERPASAAPAASTIAGLA